MVKILKRPGWRGIFLGLSIATACWGLGHSLFFMRLEEWTQDGAFSSRGLRKPWVRVIIVGVDDVTLDKLKKPLLYISPDISRVVAFLHKNGTLAIGLDIILPESLSGLPDLDAGQAGDAAVLGRTIAETKNVVLAEWATQSGWLKPVHQWRLKSILDPAPTDFGFVNITEDDDFYLRSQRMIVPEENRLHFALALLARAHRLPVAWEQGRLLIGGVPVPLDEENKLRINFCGPPGSIPIIPFWEVLEAADKGQPAPVDFHGSIVIIGVTARSQQDYHITPFGNNYSRSVPAEYGGLMAGSEIHANILATLADRAYIHKLPWHVSLGLLLGFGALLGRAFSGLNLGWGFVLALGHHFGWKGLVLASFTFLNVRVPVVPMLLLGFLAYVFTFCVRWRILRHMLGVVKSESIARLLENDPGKLDLRGEERIVTVLFADVREFTSFSETHAPRQVVALLNAYFGAIVPIIEKFGGTLNQYMGDGVMVIFGAPNQHDDHALSAVRSGVAIINRVRELRNLWSELGYPNFKIGIGIHTGRVIVGTVGSPRRLDYTAIGDTVNTAARIEAETKNLAAEILISADTYRELPIHERNALGCRPEGRETNVKGKGLVLVLHTVDVRQNVAS